MQAPGREVDIVPPQRDYLRRSEAVALGNQDGCGIPMPGSVLFGGLDEPLDLPVGEIFTAALANCYIYCGWSRLAKPRVFHGNSPPTC